MIESIFFDLDGTLADTAPDMVAALNTYLAKHNMPSVDYQQARNLCSMGSRGLLSMRGVKGDMADAIAEYLAIYQKTDYQHTTFFDGVPLMLKQLKEDGYRLGIVTNKPAAYARPILEKRLKVKKYGIRDIVCGDDYPKAKPDPMPLEGAAAQAGSKPQNCLYVGDDIRDGIAAELARMKFIAVTWGYWQPHQWEESHAPADALLSAPTLLRPALAAIRANPDEATMTVI